jgi:hypothetical protein
MVLAMRKGIEGTRGHAMPRDFWPSSGAGLIPAGVCADIGTVSAVQAEVFINDRQRNFPFERQAVVVEFLAEASIVNGFQ